MKSLCIVQARVGSTRLPRKVLEDISGKPLIARVIERVKQSRRIDEIVLATSEREEDRVLAGVAERLGILFFAGNETDVLDRFVQTTRQFGGDVVLRVTGDCPLLEPSVIDEVIKLYDQKAADYVFIQNYPRGVGDVELMTPHALEKAWDLTSPDDGYYREHVMTFIVENPQIFRVHVEEAPEKFRRPDLRLCVDERDDLQLVRTIYHFFSPREEFSIDELIGYMDSHVEVAQINANVRQRDAVVLCPKVVFIVEGNTQIGLGHFTRCIALADEFKRQKDCVVSFVTPSKALLDRAIQDAYPVYGIPDGLSRLEGIRHYGHLIQSADAVVLDVPRVEPELVEALFQQSRFLACISDENNAEIHTDVLVNPNLNADPGRTTGKGIVYCGGKDYLILRNQFRSFADKTKIIKDKVGQLFICFGGSDPNRLTERAVHVFNRLGIRDIEVLIILGGAFRNSERISDMLGEGLNYRLIHQASNVADLLWTSDLALVSGGTLMYEACALGTPCAVFSQNAEQHQEAEFFAKSGAVINLGEHHTVSDGAIEQTLKKMIVDVCFRQKLSTCARTLIDPGGTQRIAELILVELSRRQR